MKVIVEDFQSLGSVALDVPRGGLTVIVGPSDTGKSALVRALNGALFNRPGEAFVRKGKRRARVLLEDVPTITGTPLTVEWIKGHNLNQFTINGETFKKVGAKAPPLLVEAGFKDVFIGDKERSRGETLRPQMADQFDRLFLLEKPGSFVSDVLSVVSRLGVLLHASGRCASDLRSAKQMLGIRRGDLEIAEAEVKRVAGIEASLTRIEALRAEVKAAVEFGTRLERIAVLATRRARVLPIASASLVGGVSAESLRTVSEDGSRLQRASLLTTQRSALTPLVVMTMPERGVVTLASVVHQDNNLARVKFHASLRKAALPITSLALPAGFDYPRADIDARLSRMGQVYLLRLGLERYAPVAGLQMRDAFRVDVPSLQATANNYALGRVYARVRAGLLPLTARTLSTPMPAPEFQTLGTIQTRVARLGEVAQARAENIEALHSAKQGHSGADALVVEAQAALDAFKAANPSCPVCGQHWAGAAV